MTMTRTAPSLSLKEIDRRIAFHDDRQIMEINFGKLHFANSADVNAFYDRVEERIASTGETLWFFLVNYSGARIDPDAWVAFARRGKIVNLAHSMGSVRFDASAITRRQIRHQAGTEAFDPNLFADRDAALARLAEMPSRRFAHIVRTSNYRREDFEPRIHFLEQAEIMDVDFSNFTFHHFIDVNDFYDYIEEHIARTGRRWYFLINYNDCRIMPEAWVQFAHRGKALNLASSLGSVRYAAGSQTAADIRMRAESQGFTPNIRNTREEALKRINEMKAKAAHGEPDPQLSQRLRRR